MQRRNREQNGNDEQDEQQDEQKDGTSEIPSEELEQQSQPGTDTSIPHIHNFELPFPLSLLQVFDPLARQIAKIERVTNVQIVIPPGKGIMRSVVGLFSRHYVRTYGRLCNNPYTPCNSNPVAGMASTFVMKAHTSQDMTSQGSHYFQASKSQLNAKDLGNPGDMSQPSLWRLTPLQHDSGTIDTELSSENSQSILKGQPRANSGVKPTCQEKQCCKGEKDENHLSCRPTANQVPEPPQDGGFSTYSYQFVLNNYSTEQKCFSILHVGLLRNTQSPNV